MSPIGEVHIAGVTLSYVVSSLFGSAQSVRHCHGLFGYYDVQMKDTDSAESASLVQAMITSILPLESPAPPGSVLLGFASARRCGPHKLSFEDSKLLLYQNNQADTKRGKVQAAYPNLFLLVTAIPDLGTQNGTVKVEYTVFHAVDVLGSSLTNKNVIPLKVDNMIDSLSGFDRVCIMSRSNPGDHTRISLSPEHPISYSEVIFDHALTQIEGAARRKQELLQRIVELRQLLSEKKKMIQNRK